MGETLFYAKHLKNIEHIFNSLGVKKRVQKCKQEHFTQDVNPITRKPMNCRPPVSPTHCLLNGYLVICMLYHFSYETTVIVESSYLALGYLEQPWLRRAVNAYQERTSIMKTRFLCVKQPVAKDFHWIQFDRLKRTQWWFEESLNHQPDDLRVQGESIMKGGTIRSRMTNCLQKYQNIQGTFYWHGLTLVPAWISNCTHNKACD